MMEFIKSSFTKETFELMKYEFFNYNGNIPTYFIIFIISLIFILFYNRKEKKTARFQILLTSFILLLLIFFPPFFCFVEKFIGEGNGRDSWRLYWMLPIGPAISYMIVSFIKIINKEENKLINIAFIGIFAFVIIVTGQFVYTKDNFQKVSNDSKCPDEILDIITLLSNQEDDYKKVMTTIDVSPWPRQIDSNIILFFEHSPSGNFNILAKQYDSGIIDINIEKLIKSNCNYFITYDFTSSYFEIYSDYFKYIGQSRNGNYKLFKLKEDV